MNNLERGQKQYNVLVMEASTQMRDSDRCVPVKNVAKLNRMREQTSTPINIKFFVDPEEQNRDNDTTPDCLRSKKSTWKTMSVTDAVAVRLVALSGSEREIFPPRSQVYVFPAWQMQTSVSSRRGIRTYASFKKTLGRRCQSLWLSIQELDKPSCQWIG